MDLEFERDDHKNDINVRKHGIDFQDAIDVFDGRPVATIASTSPYEQRFVSTAIVQGRFMTVIWTRRDDRIRLISARRARDDEKRDDRTKHG